MSERKFKPTTNEEGQVAILYSPGYGSGWSTNIYLPGGNNEVKDFFIYGDEKIVKTIENINSIPDEKEIDLEKKEYLRNLIKEYIEDILENKFNLEHWQYSLYGLKQLDIYWAWPGEKISIQEFDGSEYIINEDDLFIVEKP